MDADVRNIFRMCRNEGHGKIHLLRTRFCNKKAVMNTMLDSCIFSWSLSPGMHIASTKRTAEWAATRWRTKENFISAIRISHSQKHYCVILMTFWVLWLTSYDKRLNLPRCPSSCKYLVIVSKIVLVTVKPTSSWESKLKDHTAICALRYPSQSF